MKINSYEIFTQMLDAPYYDKNYIQFILINLYHISYYKTNCTYKAMMQSFEEEIKKANLINPGVNSIPKPIVYSYFEFLGLHKENIAEKAKEYFKAHDCKQT